MATTISANYENRVFEHVKLTEGTKVEVHVPKKSVPNLPKSVRYSPIFGMWADRADTPEGVRYKNCMRQPR